MAKATFDLLRKKVKHTEVFFPVIRRVLWLWIQPARICDPLGTRTPVADHDDEIIKANDAIA